MRRLKKWCALALAVATPVALGAVVVPQTASADDTTTTITTKDLADSSDTQQGWLSAPYSRITLDPGNPQYPGQRGNTMPLSTNYYAYGSAPSVSPLMSVYHAEAAEPVGSSADSGTTVQGWSDDFTDVEGWSSDNVTLKGENGHAVVTTNADHDYGKIYSEWITVNLSETPKLTVAVDAAAAGANTGKWALKIQPLSGSDRKIQDDTSETGGSYEYDLSKISTTSDLTGSQTFQILLFVSGGSNLTVDFDSLQFWGVSGEQSDPEDGQTVVLADEFDSASAGEWKTTYDENRGATYSTNGDDGEVTLPDGNDWGSVGREVSVDLSATPALTVRVGSTTGKWAIKVQRSGEGDVELQHDSAKTGVFSFDVAAATGWTGQQTFVVKLFQINDGTAASSTQYERLSFHTESSWLDDADSNASTWTPEAIDWSLDYGDTGVVQGSDLPVGTDALSRLVDTSAVESGSTVLTGTYSGMASWSADTAELIVHATAGSGMYTWVASFPAGSRAYFFASSGDMTLGTSWYDSPVAGQGWWAIALPDGSTAIGVGFAVGADSAADTAATQAAHEADSPDEVTAARSGWTQTWNAFLDAVPAPQDFAIDAPGVDTMGVDSATVRQLYYRAYMNIQQNLIAATPETGGTHVQIAAGKPSGYTGGPDGAEATAAWDSLFGMQFLVYVNPEDAWDSYAGNMENAVPPADDYSAFETLPSRKAQTGWILYEATGDQEELESTYSNLVTYLDWAAEPDNMRWSYSGKGTGERDAEFVASMIVDLQYAQKISALLGHDEDVQTWKEDAATLLADYEDWFFPRDEDGTITQTLYKHWTDGRYADETGLTQYVATGLHVPGLSEDVVDALLERFDSAFSADRPLAGLADDDPSALKAPDEQFIVYGLLDQGRDDDAEQVIDIVLRDIARTGVFAEVYSLDSNDQPYGTSVAPSLFGDINFLDNVWMMNGYRMDQGDPAFVRLSTTDGGIDGLSYLGETYDADVVVRGTSRAGLSAATEDCQASVATVELSGDAVDDGLLPGSVDVSTVGETVYPTSEASAGDDCSSTSPASSPAGETTGDDASSGSVAVEGDGSSLGSSSGTAAETNALSDTGAGLQVIWALLLAGLVVVTGSAALSARIVRRRR